jgi:hypothetical protein
MFPNSLRQTDIRLIKEGYSFDRIFSRLKGNIEEAKGLSIVGRNYYLVKDVGLRGRMVAHGKPNPGVH